MDGTTELLTDVAQVALGAYACLQGSQSYAQGQRAMKQERGLSERELAEANRLTQIGLKQDTRHHDEQRALSCEQHAQSLHSGFRSTVAALREAQLQHAQSARLSYLQHLQALDVELRNGKREAERDMWEQKNNELQTLMLCASVLIGGSLAILVEGDLPKGLDEWQVVLFGGITAVGFVAMLLAILFALLAIKLLGHFMAKKSEVHRLDHHCFLRHIGERAQASLDPKDHNFLPAHDPNAALRHNLDRGCGSYMDKIPELPPADNLPVLPGRFSGARTQRSFSDSECANAQESVLRSHTTGHNNLSRTHSLHRGLTATQRAYRTDFKKFRANSAKPTSEVLRLKALQNFCPWPFV